MNVGIVIINYNSGGDLATCLLKIDEAEGDRDHVSEVVIVDNNSEDDSLEGLPEIGIPTTVEKNPENTGFGHACNHGVGQLDADVDAYFFLNPDVRLRRSTLPPALSQFDDDVGVVGPQNVRFNGVVRRTCAHSPTLSRMILQYHGIPRLLPGAGVRMGDWDHDETRPVDHVMGGCYLIRSDVFHEVGGFDPSFFVFYEDVDLSKRVREAGYEIVFCAESRVSHPSGGGVNVQRLGLSLDGRIRYASKHFSAVSTAVLFLTMFTSEFLVRVAHSALRNSMNGPADVARGYAFGLKQRQES